MSTETDQIVVLIGNPNPQMQVRVPIVEAGEVVGHDQQSVAAPHLNQSVTRVEMWPGIDDPDLVELTLSTDNDRMLALIARNLGTEHRRYAIAVNEVEQLLQVHSAGEKPDWISSNDEGLAKALAHHFDCAIGEPVALLTNGGRDALHAQHMSTSAQPAAFNYLALTANATAPAGADTTLTAEIATAGGGLIRAQATYAHTAGTNTTTLTKTFTANGSDSLPVTVAKTATFNASTVGTMGEEDLLSSTATLTTSGDNVAITYTLTAG